jgi:hypothetical protein
MSDEKKESTLSQVPKGERDSQLNDAPQPTPASHQKQERLQLPLGALIAFRKSGGLRFSSREIVVYPDGRVSYGGPDESKQAYARASRKLNDAQIARLRKMLDQAGFFRLESTKGEQPPDSFAYEIAARLGKRSNFVQVFDGSIPDALTPLIQQLSALFPKDRP